MLVRMRRLKFIAVAAAACVAAGCTTSFYTAQSSAYDDMYVAHNRTVIEQKQQAEAEARRAEAEARRAEAEALRAQYEAEIARLRECLCASSAGLQVGIVQNAFELLQPALRGLLHLCHCLRPRFLQYYGVG